MDRQIKIHDYLDIKSKDYCIGIKASGDHTQAGESVRGHRNTLGLTFPVRGSLCHPAGYFPKISDGI